MDYKIAAYRQDKNKVKNSKNKTNSAISYCSEVDRKNNIIISNLSYGLKISKISSINNNLRKINKNVRNNLLDVQGLLNQLYLKIDNKHNNAVRKYNEEIERQRKNNYKY